MTFHYFRHISEPKEEFDWFAYLMEGEDTLSTIYADSDVRFGTEWLAVYTLFMCHSLICDNLFYRNIDLHKFVDSLLIVHNCKKKKAKSLYFSLGVIM